MSRGVAVRSGLPGSVRDGRRVVSLPWLALLARTCSAALGEPRVCRKLGANDLVRGPMYPPAEPSLPQPPHHPGVGGRPRAALRQPTPPGSSRPCTSPLGHLPPTDHERVPPLESETTH